MSEEWEREDNPQAEHKKSISAQLSRQPAAEDDVKSGALHKLLADKLSDGFAPATLIILGRDFSALTSKVT